MPRLTQVEINIIKDLVTYAQNKGIELEKIRYLLSQLAQASIQDLRSIFGP